MVYKGEKLVPPYVCCQLKTTKDPEDMDFPCSTFLPKKRNRNKSPKECMSSGGRTSCEWARECEIEGQKCQLDYEMCFGDDDCCSGKCRSKSYHYCLPIS